MAPRTLFKLPPDTPAKWSIAAANAGLINQTIKSRGSLESGSKITEEQFLLLRILTTTAAPGSLNPNRWGLTPYIAQAQAALLNPGFLQFLGAIPAGAGAARIPGAFRQAQIQYLEVIEGLTKKKQLEDIDETSINSSLITLLQGITDLVPTAGRRWRSRHVKLTINYGRRPGDKKDRKFTAVTDGQLQRSGGGRAISALVECKRAPRMEKRHKEAMQEAAEFATWVGDYRTGPGHA
ncbi:hypothetical protein Aspvir_007293 [Aspergillus viridinutans]|uniref:Uncharacterized protein n=1 Tax=Aspergillus viridinutans TaxID=75553 RepID=A0A9P3F350_ASPVI|nr:uncharacterized protein Aspvir_007293 [Aspergillus viridinutans]GIK03224.1 hypothetical protein Aspvir_007293 [Aspergillus viridinutans]